MARVAIVVTVVSWCGYTVTWVFQDLLSRAQSRAVGRAEAIVYLLIVSALSASTVAYLLSRLGFFYRARAHHRATRAALDDFYDRATPSLTALVPSYREDARVIRNALLTAALQEYPDLRVVLLIDDPAPRTVRERELLASAEALPREIEDLLAWPAAHFAEALEAFEASVPPGGLVDNAAVRSLAAEYEAASTWLENLAAGEDVVDHVDAFVANEVLRRLAEDMMTVATALRQAAEEGASFPLHRARQLYRRLAWTFKAELSSFQRKCYVSLSHEPNKAMNLNSYIGLMGHNYREAQTVSGVALVPADTGPADLAVPSPDYVLTLDADSVLLPEYCLRLVHLLEQQEHRDVAIAQTPYSAFPGSATRLERIAGATTDLQHLVHQGLSYYDATFWVGANAVIRKPALDDIATTWYLGDWEVRSYIKDRTVIEDTESTVDLGVHGWRLLNCPERLSYSATPPDFGSLCIQRQRWATGGLIILPKLRLQVRARRAAGGKTRFGELFLRTNYMASIAWSSLSLLFLLAFPFNATLISPWLFVLALPYFWAMASDLRYCGYKRSDVARIYGFNLILLPVNVAGVVATAVQAITASKGTFSRTPKVRDRTVAPPLFVIAPYLVVALAAFTFLVAYEHDRRINMAYASLNGALALYAIAAFIGPRNSLVDAWVHFKSLLYVPAEPKRRRRRRRRAALGAPPAADWRTVLQVGPSRPQWRAPVSAPMPAQSVARLPEPDEFRIVFQPVASLATGDTLGYEALARFADGTSPERWLSDAVAAGTSTALEGLLVRAALTAAGSLPSDTWLAVKASPRLIEADGNVRHLLGAPGRHLVVEVTEPSTSDIPPELRRLPSLLPPNVSLAVEHAGVGHKSLNVLMELSPSYVKLDRRVVVGLAGDRARRAQVAALVRLADEHACAVVACGLEDEDDRDAARELGVSLGQGYLIARPEEFARV
jgi:EAL domain-containing protein (putative c-di-GMP-specific phosphodiesterase class I)/cellulose synthase/poly-beta-1,6-N-acetylglucosamine synthase-like glycosyltransferase